mgnify:CR=1 FL=1
MSLGINSHINSGINSGSDCYSVIIGRFQPLHKGHGYLIKQALKNSDYLSKNIICLPLHLKLSKKDVKYICTIFNKLI